jgi:RNA polymerase subunit RPABC4/transcription elongation factor Spt4
MKVGLIDVDSHNFPNLPLMKLSAWHKKIGDKVDWYLPIDDKYDLVYQQKIFSFTADYGYHINADKVIKGGTGYCIELIDGKEIFDKSKNVDLPYEIEHIYPDYSIYPQYPEAYGFLSRGCPRNCDFCIVGKKEGCRSVKVADLSEFWRGQEVIRLLDPNILACADRIDLLQQLIDSKAKIEFTQGLDIRLTDEKVNELIMKCKLNVLHFAWDKEKDSDIIISKLTEFKKQTNIDYRKAKVYMLTNFDTDFDFDIYRVELLKEMGFDPYVMIYDKIHCEQKYKDLQRYCNNKIIFRSSDCKSFSEYKKHIE